MNRQATQTPPMSFYMVIPSPSLLTIDCYFFFSFPSFFPFHSLSFQSLLDLLCQAFKPSQYGILTEYFSMFFLFFIFFSSDFQGYLQGFSRFFLGEFPLILIKSQLFDQSERVLKKKLTTEYSCTRLVLKVLIWFQGYLVVLDLEGNKLFLAF